MKSLDLVGFFGFAVQLAYSAPLPLPTNELELIQTSAAAIIPYSSYSSATTPSPALIESLSFDGPIPPDVIDRDFADDATEDYVALQINHTDKSSPNNTESTSLFLPSSDNYHNLHSEVEGDDRNNVKDFKFHTHLGCCRKLLICGGCSSGLLQPKPKAFASYNPILRFLNILIIFVLTLLSDPHVDWHNSTAILSALKSPDLFSAVCAEPGADEKMAVIEGILQNVSRLTEAKNQVDKLSIAKNWTEDMLGNAIFNGVLLFPRQCSQQEAENVIRIAKTTKCSRQICIDPPASGFCGEFTVPDPSTDVAHTALQDLMDSVLKTCNVDSKSLFPGVTDFVLGLLGIPSIEVPCPEWKEVDVNFVITAMQQTTVVQKCVTPPSPQCTNISLPCPPDALIAKMASLDEFHKTMSIQIKNIVSGLGTSIQDAAQTALTNLVQDVQIVVSVYNWYFAASLLFAKPFMPYGTRTSVPRWLLQQISSIPKIMFVALGTIFLEVYNYIDFPEIRVYLDIFFRDPCSFNPELTAKRTEAIASVCAGVQELEREFNKLQNAIKTNCGDASISPACMYDTWIVMGNDLLLPYPGASNDGSVFLPDGSKYGSMTFEEAIKLVNETFIGYCDPQVFWDATAAVQASETEGHVDLSEPFKKFITFMAPLFQISVLLTVIHHAFAMIHPEGSTGGKYLVPDGFKDDTMDEDRMKTVIRLKNVVPLAAWATLYVGILYLTLAPQNE